MWSASGACTTLRAWKIPQDNQIVAELAVEALDIVILRQTRTGVQAGSGLRL